MFPTRPSTFAPRAAMLARLALGSPPLRAALHWASVLGGSLAAGLAGGAVWMAAGPSGPGPFGAAIAAALAAGAAGATLHVLLLERLRRRQATDFAHMARRLGELRTSGSEMRGALRRLSGALERAVPEVLADDDDSVLPGSLPAGPATRVLFPMQAAQRDQHLARRLLRISRAAAFFGGADLELRRVAMAGPCAEVLEQYRRLTGPDQEILYIEDGGGDWLAAPLDRPLFVLLLRELLDNVFEHAGDWNRITVTTEPVPGAIVLRVRDDGRGIPREAVRGIMAGGVEGFRGLGLPMVRAIVEAHGGSFRVESESGLGTSVNLRFPTHV